MAEVGGVENLDGPACEDNSSMPSQWLEYSCLPAAECLPRVLLYIKIYIADWEMTGPTFQTEYFRPNLEVDMQLARFFLPTRLVESGLGSRPVWAVSNLGFHGISENHFG
jgi:hypothetical protein